MQNATTSKRRFFGTLYWRISAIFLIILAFVGLAYTLITAQLSDVYFQQVNQRLNRNTASDIASHLSPFKNGHVDETAMAELFHNIMVINPSLEVYLLDANGNILSYYAPAKKIVLAHINLIPVKEFIKLKGTELVLGDDPRHPGKQKVFSVASIWNGREMAGYIYVVLASEEYDNAITHLRSNYILKIGSRSMLVTLLFALSLGLIIIWLVTKNLRKIIEVMQKFKNGDLTARIEMHSKGDIKEISGMFNEMADLLTNNIEKIKEVDVLRRELIANISHDLRTPISIIHGYVETLLMKREILSEADRSRYLNTIYESIQKLEKLVNELFELSKLEANQVKALKEPFFISELVSDISNKYQLIAHDKSISLNTNLSKESQRVFADVSLIERVIQNLLDNALKFTPAGGRLLFKLRNHKKESGFRFLIQV